MTLKLFQLISIIVAALVSGMFFGPWLALSRSMAKFDLPVFLAVVHRLNKNMAPLMTFLMLAALLSVLPLLWLSLGGDWLNFYLSLVALLLFLLSLYVTMAIEVPIVMQIVGWEQDAPPADWKTVRDQWVSFHVIRVVAGFMAFVFLVVGAIF